MSTQGVDHVVEGPVVRGEAQEFGHRPASRGSVALFTDSLEGMGAVAAQSLVRGGYAVRLYCAVKRELAAGGSHDVNAAG
jgi:hypothetical protein